MKKPTFFFLILTLGLALNSCDKAPNEPPVVIEPTEEIDFVFASDETGIIEIWMQENGERTKLTDNPERNSWWPQFNPNGGSVLYVTTPFGEDLQDVKETELRIFDLETAEDIVIINQSKYNWNATAWPQWSSDGNSIVLSYKEDSDSKWQLAIVDKNGNDVQAISSRRDYDYLDPVFSPDMKRVYCSVVPNDEHPDSENYEIHEIELNTGTEKRLTTNEYRDQHPDINSNGTELIYESLVDPEYLSIGKWNTHSFDLNSGASKPLLEEDQLNFQAKYINDEQIVFIRLDILQLNTGFHMMRLRDKSITPLLTEKFNAINIDPIAN